MKIVTSIIFIMGIFTMSFNTEEYSPAYDKFINSYSKQVLRNCNLELVGEGGQLANGIKLSSIYLSYSKEINISCARQKLIKAAGLFLKNINQEKKLQPYFNSKFFKLKDLHMVVFLEKNDPHQFCSIELDEGKIVYEKLIKRFEYETILEETYEEALEKVKQEEKKDNLKN